MPGRSSISGAAPPRPLPLPRQEAPSAQIARHLVDYLLSGELLPGQRIPSERQLADALGVGRSGVREGIKSLHFLGLLEVRQGDGTYLSRSESELLPGVVEWGLLLGERSTAELLEAWRQLEIILAGLAAEHGTAASVTRLNELVAEMAAVEPRSGAYVEADAAFHLEIAKASRNGVLANLVTTLQALLGLSAFRANAAFPDSKTVVATQARVVEAIAERDAEKARAAMAEHLQSAHAQQGTATEAVGGRRSRVS